MTFGQHEAKPPPNLTYSRCVDFKLQNPQQGHAGWEILGIGVHTSGGQLVEEAFFSYAKMFDMTFYFSLESAINSCKERCSEIFQICTSWKGCFSPMYNIYLTWKNAQLLKLYELWSHYFPGCCMFQKGCRMIEVEGAT